MSAIIKNVRINAARSGGVEVLELASNEGFRDLFSQRQKLIAEMNAAKIKAAEEAAKPFIKRIEDLDRQYAMMLTMISDT